MKVWKKSTALLVAACALLSVNGNSSMVTAEVSETTSLSRSFVFDESMEGKKFVFYGDSITERLYLNADDNDYIQNLQEEYGFYAYNGGVCGATWTVVPGGTNHIFTQLEESKILYTNADYVSIFLGTNDFSTARAMGNISAPAGKDTIFGAMRLALDIIIEANPDVKIMLITPLWREGGYNATKGAGYTLKDVCAAIIALGEEYGCKVVDTTDLVTEQNAGSLLFVDKLHVTKEGYKALADYIKSEK